MKKAFRATALALSFASIAAVSMSTTQFATVAKPKPGPGTTPDTIPIPKCSPGDPNGCCIYCRH